MEKLLKAREAMEFLNIAKSTFIKWVKNGIIPSTELNTFSDGRKVRRYKLSDLQNLGKEKQMVIPLVRKHKKTVKNRKILKIA